MKALPLACAFLLACTAGSERGPRFTIAVAPLELDDVFDAEYTLSVWNGHSPRQLVWTQTGLRSTRFGDGRGSLTYIGTCDASEPASMVELVIEHLYTKNGAGALTEIPASTWRNPSKPDSLKLYPTCKENQDVLVSFDVTLMRDAEQGFFDVAVNFADVFCSAKVGCDDALLFNGGERDLTFIVGFACTSGVGDPTWLYLDDLAIECTRRVDGVVTTTRVPIDPDQAPGQHGPLGAGVFEHAIYQGDEDFEGFDKCYWNTAIGVRETWLAGFDRCVVTGRGTAGTAAWAGNRTPPRATWPIIVYDAEIWNASNQAPKPKLSCFDHPLDGTPAGVSTGYTDGAAELGIPFQHRVGCGKERVTCDVPLGRRAQASAAVAVEGTPGGRSLTISMAAGGRTVSGTWNLPGDTTLSALEGCCTDECCASPQ